MQMIGLFALQEYVVWHSSADSWQGVDIWSQSQARRHEDWNMSSIQCSVPIVSPLFVFVTCTFHIEYCCYCSKLSDHIFFSLFNQLCNCFKLLIPLFCCVLQYDGERTHGVLLCRQVRLL